MTADSVRAYRYRPSPLPVAFERRLHRFGAWVRDRDGRRRLAHLPNPGRMAELLVPGARGWLVRATSAGRSTYGTLVAVEHRGTLVSIDTILPNRLVGQQLRAPGGPRAWGLPDGPWRAEVGYGESRFDFALPAPSGDGWSALLEVKSANLRVGTAARFPDAPTVRGTRHVRELTRAAKRGVRAAVVFVVQRDDVEYVAPNRPLDPAFAHACDVARGAGVGFYGVGLRVTRAGAGIARSLRVRFRLS